MRQARIREDGAVVVHREECACRECSPPAPHSGRWNRWTGGARRRRAGEW